MTGDGVRRADDRPASGPRRPRRPGWTVPSRAAGRSSRANLALVRTELGRFGRQVSGYALEHLLPERGFDVARVLVGSEGTLGGRARCDRPSGRRAAAPGPGRARLPRHGRRRRRRPRAAALRPDRAARAWTRGSSTWSAAAGPAAVARRCPRRRAGCSSSWPAATAGRGAGRRATGSSRRRRGGRSRRGSSPTGPQAARAVADPRGRRRARRPHARRAAGATPGWEDAAVPPERLGAYLRDFDALLDGHGLTALPYGHFGDGCLHVRIDFPLDREPAGARGSGPSSPTPPGSSRRTAVRCPASTATAGPAASCCRSCTPRPRSALFAQVKARLRPGQRAQPRHHRAARARSTPTCGCRSRRPSARNGSPSAYPHDGGDFTPAVHRCTGVGKCRADTTASGGVMCPSYQATRDEKDSTRGRARVLQEMPTARLVTRHGLALARGPRGAGPVSVLQGLRVRLPHRGRHGHLQGRGAAPDLPRPAAARARTTRSAGCRCWPGLAARMPRLANASPRSRLGGALARWAGGHRPAAGAAPRSRRRRSGAWFSPAAMPPAHVADAPAARSCCGSTPSPTTSPRRSPSPPWRCWRTPATPSQVPRGALLRADLDHDRAARRGPRASSGAPSRRCAPRVRAAGSRSSGSSRPAPRSSAATRAELLPRRARRRRRRGGDAHARRAARRDARLDARRPLAASSASRSRTATSTRSWAGRPTRAAARRPAPTSRGSAAAAGWPATSASSAGTTTCRWPSPRQRCCRPCGRAAGRRRAGRRVLLPHPARPARRPAGGAPRRAARRAPSGVIAASRRGPAGGSAARDDERRSPYRRGCRGIQRAGDRRGDGGTVAA